MSNYVNRANVTFSKPPLIQGRTDLASQYPECMSLWSWNGENSFPWDINIFDDKEVTLRCHEGHSIKMTLQSLIQDFEESRYFFEMARIHQDSDLIIERGDFSDRNCLECQKNTDLINSAVIGGNIDLLKAFYEIKRTDGRMLHEEALEKPHHVKIKMKDSVTLRCPKCDEIYTSTVGSWMESQEPCTLCRRKKRSEIEGLLFDSLSRHYPVSIDTPNQVVWKKDGKEYVADCDIVIPGANVVIEYDGFFNHREDDGVVVDTLKTKALLDSGYFVIRIRDIGLVSLEQEIDSDRYCEIMVKMPKRKNQYATFINNLTCRLLEEIDSSNKRGDEGSLFDNTF